MRLTRRQAIGGAAAAAVGATGVYELVDRFASSPERASPVGRRPEQHVLDGQRIVVDEGVEVVVPPLHHAVVTARVTLAGRRAELGDARIELARRLATLEDELPPTPAGLGIVVAWGNPYFERYVPRLADRHIPADLRASRARGREVRALTEAIRFPSDPDDTVLERNDLAVLLRSDRLAHVQAAEDVLFAGPGDFLAVTSIRRGFAGGGFEGRRSLPKRMAMAAGVRGAELVPDTAELFLGFTSTQRSGLGPPRIANLETLGFADMARSDYFRGGTHMHLSHLFENLEAWYLDFDPDERVATTFRPGLRVRHGAQTVRQAPKDVADGARVRADFQRAGTIGHSAAVQTSSRLERDVVGADGVRYPRGTAIPQRADFNTLDNPFAWSADPERDEVLGEPAAGVHFVTFNPTSDDFHRNRLAMDGVLPDGTRRPFAPRARGQGFNAVLRTTHRQNFLVPPRRHRSFPLVELRG